MQCSCFATVLSIFEKKRFFIIKFESCLQLYKRQNSFTFKRIFKRFQLSAAKTKQFFLVCQSIKASCIAHLPKYINELCISYWLLGSMKCLQGSQRNSYYFLQEFQGISWSEYQCHSCFISRKELGCLSLQCVNIPWLTFHFLFGFLCTFQSSCVKRVQIWSLFWSVFSRIWTRIRKDTEYLSVFSPNAGKYGPEKTPYLDTFHTTLANPIHGNFAF